jgi:hypothetical protein
MDSDQRSDRAPRRGLRAPSCSSDGGPLRLAAEPSCVWRRLRGQGLPGGGRSLSSWHMRGSIQRELLDRGTRLVFESGRPVAHVAKDLGIESETLRKHVRQTEADEGRRKDVLSSQEHEEIKSLAS